MGFYKVNKYNCKTCIYNGSCNVKQEYEEEIQRISDNNKLEERSFITIVNCNNYEEYISRNKSKDEDPKVFASSFRYDCYFKSDLKKKGLLV